MQLLPNIGPGNVKTNLANLYYFKEAFSEDNIKRLEQMLIDERYQFQKGRTGVAELGNDTDSYETNNRDIAYIHPAEHSLWLYNLLEEFALEANNNMFYFDIDIVSDPIHYVIYPEDGGHLDWHMDVGYGAVNKRKLAMTVQLSDPYDYEGGDFEVWYGGKDKFVTVPRLKGDILVFPAFLMHRVKPITRGQRKCIVFWTGSTRAFR